MTDSPRHSTELPVESEEWLSRHPDEDRSDLEKVWLLSEYADEPFDPDPDRVAKMREALSVRIERPTGLTRFVAHRRPLIWAAAAAVIVALAASWWLQPVRYQAPHGETLAVVLPDGSEIELNSGSTISYGATFGWRNRSLKLTGEAFFDVVSDKGGFEVLTFNGRIEVVGTQFNVRAWPNDPEAETSVFVEEGRVRASSLQDPERPVILQANQAVSIRKSTTGLAVLEVNPAVGEGSWRRGGMVFTDKPIRTILDEIERRFQIEVRTFPDSLAMARITLHLSKPAEVGTILEMIAAANDLNVERTADGFVLVSK